MFICYSVYILFFRFFHMEYLSKQVRYVRLLAEQDRKETVGRNGRKFKHPIIYSIMFLLFVHVLFFYVRSQEITSVTSGQADFIIVPAINFIAINEFCKEQARCSVCVYFIISNMQETSKRTSISLSPQKKESCLFRV